MISSLITEPFLLKDLQERYNFVVEYRRNPSVLSDAMLGITDRGSSRYREGQKDGVIVNFGSFLRPGFQSTQELINKLINQ